MQGPKVPEIPVQDKKSGEVIMQECQAIGLVTKCIEDARRAWRWRVAKAVRQNLNRMALEIDGAIGLPNVQAVRYAQLEGLIELLGWSDRYLSGQGTSEEEGPEWLEEVIRESVEFRIRIGLAGMALPQEPIVQSTATAKVVPPAPGQRQ